MSTSPSDEDLVVTPPDRIERARFMYHLLVDFRMESLILMYALPTDGRVFKFSISALIIKVVRAVFVLALKNLVLSLVSEGKMDSGATQSEEIINIPRVSSPDRTDRPAGLGPLLPEADRREPHQEHLERAQGAHVPELPPPPRQRVHQPASDQP
jgi:hypothetical protein